MQRRDVILRALVDVNSRRHVTLFTLVIRRRGYRDLYVLKAIVLVERFDRVLVAGCKSLGVATMAQPDEAGRLQEDAIADLTGWKIVISLDINAHQLLAL